MDETEKRDGWRAGAMEQWIDDRHGHHDQVEIWIWFFIDAWADFQKVGLELEGWSVKPDQHGTLMVLKLNEGGTPLVAFVTDADTTHCMHRVRECIRNGGLKTYPDRFR
jgi:hypothetical protein